MSEPFLAEIRMVGFNFAPRGWAFCDGQILPINQNQALFSILGTVYGGDGRTSFALPDLRSRTPIHEGDGVSLGHKGGAEIITLTTAQMPAHRHAFRVRAEAQNRRTPANTVLANSRPDVYNSDTTSTATLGAETVVPAGGGQYHNNMQPYLTIAFCIALQGLFPSRN